MDDSTADDGARRRSKKRREGGGGGPSSGGEAVYGLGLIGALVYTWQHASGFGEHLVGILKSFVWPAFLVYDAFKALHG